MKTKSSAQSVIFNSKFLIGLCVFLVTGLLFAAANSSGLDSGAFSNASARSNLKNSLRPLGGQCVPLRGCIVPLSTDSGIAAVDTAPAAFNTQDDEFLIGWDQLIGSTWTVNDQRLAVDGTLLGENNPVIEGTDTFI